MKGLPATLVHFGAVWGTALIMLPKHDAAEPVTEQEPKAIAIDAFHHAVYAVTSGLVFDALDAGSNNERKLKQLSKSVKNLVGRFK